MDAQFLTQLTEFSKDKNVIYVEDNRVARDQTVKMLSSIFTDVDQATDGLEGLLKFQENDYDIIFTDINMPKLNGLEMIKEIRKIDTEIPCIVLSAHDEEEFSTDSSQLNIEGHLFKPIEFEQFYSTIFNTLKKMHR